MASLPGDAILSGTGWHRLWAMLSLIHFGMLQKNGLNGYG